MSTTDTDQCGPADHHGEDHERSFTIEIRTLAGHGLSEEVIGTELVAAVTTQAVVQFRERNELAEGLWVPEIVSPHATCEYSWIRPPSRSRPRTRTSAPRVGGCGRPAGGLWCNDRCGR